MIGNNYVIYNFRPTNKQSSFSGGLSIDKSVILLFLTILMIMFPTSTNGSLIETPKVIIYGYSIVVLLLFPSLNKKKAVIAFFCLTIIVFFTLISDGHISGINQFIPLVSFYIIITLEYKNISVSERALSNGLGLLLVIIIFLGYSVLYENEAVISILVKYYAFGYGSLAETMYSEGKPILFFISHAIAAIAYAIIFFIAVLWGKHTKQFFFYLLAFLMIPLIIALKSNTSYLALFVIFSYFFILLSNTHKILYLFISALVLYYFKTEIIGMNLDVDFFLGNSNNGFLSRYDSQDGVYAEVFKHILSSPLIGTGLLFGEDQYKADSGIANELLRGGIVYFVFMKYLMYLAIYKNTNKKTISIIIVVFFLLMEIAYAFTLSLRGPVMMLLILLYLNSIYKNKSNVK